MMKKLIASSFAFILVNTTMVEAIKSVVESRVPSYVLMASINVTALFIIMIVIYVRNKLELFELKQWHGSAIVVSSNGKKPTVKFRIETKFFRGVNLITVDGGKSKSESIMFNLAKKSGIIEINYTYKNSAYKKCDLRDHTGIGQIRINDGKIKNWEYTNLNSERNTFGTLEVL